MRTLPQLEDDTESLPAAGLGAMATASGNLPLTKIDVRSFVDGLACRTVIAQVFRNPHGEFVEATYIFPLPGRFAVTACTMRVKDRVIEAELKERSQARADYDRAIRAGHRASIAEEERSETFNLRVGNIPPQEEVAVELTLIGAVSIVAGEATLRIPLVVAPRYVPGTPLDGPSVGGGTAVDTDEVPDASRVTPPTLLPGFPNPVELTVEVTLEPGKLIAGEAWRDRVRASLHSTFVAKDGPCVVRLLPGERINRDFILRWPILPDSICSALEYSHPHADRAGTFAVTVMPPAKPSLALRPRDVVFVLDRSGSMEGWKIAAARRAVARMIDSLRDEDRFRVLAFDEVIETPTGRDSDWQDATDRSRWQAAEWVAKINARGGTELGGALLTALQPFATFGMPEGREAVVVVVTDGQVAGEDSVLRTIRRLRLPRMPRIFTLGIDRAVNASMLTKLADLGGGSFELVESEQRLDEVMERFHRDIGAPVLTDVHIEPLDFDLVSNSVTPGRLENLFADRPLMVFGRVAGRRDTLRLRITARQANGEAWQAELTARQADSPALLPLWGRSRVRDLEDEYACGDDAASKLPNKIVAVSLESGVLSRFTAYVAVDHAEVVNQGGSQHEIVQPVEAPEGWEMQSAFRGGMANQRAYFLHSSTADETLFCAAPPPSVGHDSVASMRRKSSETAIDFTETTDDDLDDSFDDRSPVARLVQFILAEAVQSRASHILLRPEDAQLKVIYIINGMAHERDCPPRRLLDAVINRLCILAKIDVAATGLKAGVMTFTARRRSQSLRVYIIPTDDGPCAVVRLANQANAVLATNVPSEIETWLRDAQAACDPGAENQVYQQLLADSTN